MYLPQRVCKVIKQVKVGLWLTWCDSYHDKSRHTKLGTISNRNLIWMIGSNVSNEMMLHMQIRMLSIPLVKCENNVYRPKTHFWRLVKLINTFHVNMLKRYYTILVWCFIGKYNVFVVKWHFSYFENMPKRPCKTSREMVLIKC